MKTEQKKYLVSPSLLSADFVHLDRDLQMINESEADYCIWILWTVCLFLISLLVCPWWLLSLKFVPSRWMCIL